MFSHFAGGGRGGGKGCLFWCSLSSETTLTSPHIDAVGPDSAQAGFEGIGVGAMTADLGSAFQRFTTLSAKKFLQHAVCAVCLPAAPSCLSLSAST